MYTLGAVELGSDLGLAERGCWVGALEEKENPNKSKSHT